MQIRANLIVKFDPSVNGKTQMRIAAHGINDLLITLESMFPNYELSEPLMDKRTISVNYKFQDSDVVEVKSRAKR